MILPDYYNFQSPYRSFDCICQYETVVIYLRASKYQTYGKAYIHTIEECAYLHHPFSSGIVVAIVSQICTHTYTHV